MLSQKEIIKKINEAVKTDPDKDYIQNIYLFGSHLHGDATENSDIDLLFKPKKKMGYFKLFSIQSRLSNKIGKPVELLTKQELSKYFREKVIKEAKKVY
jgi:hypothetical protein